MNDLKKRLFKKLPKLIGSVIMVLVAVYIVKKVMDMDIRLADFRSGRIITALVTAVIIQTAVIVISCIPWMMFIRSLSGIRVTYPPAMAVYTQSNIYKYLPGNVFQYVGRNKLAFDLHISHVDVACSTVMEVLFCVFWTGIFSVAFLGGQIASLLVKYGRNFIIIGVVGIIIAAALLGLLWWKFRDRLKEYLSRYSKAFAPERRRGLAVGIFYYVLHNALLAVSYFTCLHLVLGDSCPLSELISFTGAYMFAWIVGFITPGAPGGIGIREGVMIFVSGDSYSDRIVLFVLVMRLASIIADIAAYSIGRAVALKTKRPRHS